MTLLILIAIPSQAMSQELPELAAPIKIFANGEPINAQRGHLAPFIADFTGDGVKHLLVGHPGEGRLRIYRNAGTAADPRFANYVWLREGEDDGTVPAN
jgi:hypothetical protein